MSTVVAGTDWIKRVADDERARDAVRAKRDELAAHKANLVRRYGRLLIDELHGCVTRDVTCFCGEFPGDPARQVIVEAIAPGGGFAVRKPAPAPASLTVTPNLEGAAMACHYRFTLASGFPPREDRIDVCFSDDAHGALQMTHQGSGQVFATADALSEFLLVPVLTGRPR